MSKEELSETSYPLDKTANAAVLYEIKNVVFEYDENDGFGFGYSNSYMVTVKIPEGYEVAELPKSEKIKMPEGLGTFSFISSSRNGAIQLRVVETVSNPLITAEDYQILKEFFNNLIIKENEQVVLKKV